MLAASERKSESEREGQLAKKSIKNKKERRLAGKQTALGIYMVVVGPLPCDFKLF
jgi:hypothetical protein